MTYELKRRPTALSYSSLSLYLKDADEFYLRYLAGVKAPRLPQENYMSIGSAGDARIKSALYAAIFGPDHDVNFSFKKLFEDSVEPHNRDWALVESQYVFDCYVRSGAYDDLLGLLLQSVEPPQFESSVTGLINGVPFTGKPDCRFMLRFPDCDLLRIILDWKVKGYCSKNGASPSKGYALCRDGYDFLIGAQNATKAAPLGKPSQSHNKSHDLYLPYDHRGLTINEAFMETCNAEYADQVSCYGWMLGETPGDENVVVFIDELLAKFMGEGNRPLLRIASHRARVSRDHQLELVDKITGCWNAITSGHVFRDLSRSDSDDRCELLDDMAIGLQTDGSSEEDFFNECTRPQFKR